MVSGRQRLWKSRGGDLGLDAFGEKRPLGREVGDALPGGRAVLFAAAGEAGLRGDLDFHLLVAALVVSAEAGASLHALILRLRAAVHVDIAHGEASDEA